MGGMSFCFRGLSPPGSKDMPPINCTYNMPLSRGLFDEAFVSKEASIQGVTGHRWMLGMKFICKDQLTTEQQNSDWSK